MDIKVLEWSNPDGKDISNAAKSDVSQFEDFIARSGSSSGLSLVPDDVDMSLDIEDADEKPKQTAKTKQLILIEEFPNTFSKDCYSTVIVARAY